MPLEGTTTSLFPPPHSNITPDMRGQSDAFPQYDPLLVATGPYFSTEKPTILQIEDSYVRLLGTIFQKLFLDTQSFSCVALKASSRLSQSSWGLLKAIGKESLGLFLMLVVKTWTLVLWALLSSVWYLLVNFTLYALTIVLLYGLTTLLVRTLKWIFGGWPVLIMRSALWLLKNIWKGVFSKSSYIKEKAVEGFLTYRIDQSPPRNCLVVLQHKDGSHAGYASCVRLYNGENGLMTAEHVLQEIGEEGWAVSTKTGTKIPMTQFQFLIKNEKDDFSLMRGPPNWEGLLGVKSAHFTTAKQLAKSKCSIYDYDGVWHSSNGEVVGCEGFKATVLSNTKPGFSGSPYFNGKTILGIHVGGSSDGNVNLLTPIPPIPGLTSPIYVYETTAPQGVVFTDVQVEKYSKAYLTRELEERLNWKPLSGAKWADYEEETTKKDKGKSPLVEEPYHDTFKCCDKSCVNKNCAEYRMLKFDAMYFHFIGDCKDPVCQDENCVEFRKHLQLKIQKESQGNGKSSGACSTNVQASSTPSNVNASGEILEKVVAALVSKINLSSVEKMVVDEVAKKAQKPKRKSRGKKKPMNTQPTSPPSTTGVYQPPHKRPGSPVLEKSATSPASTTLSKKSTHAGGQNSQKSTQNWEPKPGGSDGLSSGQKPN